jgi:hypothetical protein
LNNRAGNSHRPTLERERRTRAIRDPERTQVFLSSIGPIRQHFALKRHRPSASFYRRRLGERFAHGIASLNSPKVRCFLRRCASLRNCVATIQT